MAKKKNSKEYPRQINRGKQPEDYKNIQRTSSLIHLVGRMGYTIIAWFVLSIGDMSSPTVFVSLFLFAAPVLMDSFLYCFSSWSRKWIVAIELCVCGLWVLFSLLGLTGVVSVNEHECISFATKSVVGQGDIISVKYLWYALGSIPFITCVDFACRYSVKDDLRQAKGEGE